MNEEQANHLLCVPFQGRRTKIGQGGGELLGPECAKNFPPLSDFSLSWALLLPPMSILFQFFSLYHQVGQIFRVGELPPPPEKLSIRLWL